jgi:creatinine amidohydrolase
MKKLLFAEMTHDDVNEAVLEGRVVLIPVGQLETHGPHLPIDVDTVQVDYVCTEAARGAPDVLLAAPPIFYAFSEHVMDFPGTMAVQPETLLAYLVDIGNSFARQGFEKIVLVNGHGSNRSICEIASRRITNASSAYCATLTHFSLITDVMQEIRESEVGGIAHGGEVETSEYMFLRPDLVKKDKIKDEFAPDYRPWRADDFAVDGGPIHFMEYWSQRSKSGIEGAPSLATPEKGEKLLIATIERMIEFGKWWKELEFPPRTDYTVRRDKSKTN